MAFQPTPPATAAPTSILRVPLVPPPVSLIASDPSSACGRPPTERLRPPAVPAREGHFFWVPLVPSPVSSIASDPSSACDSSPTSVLMRRHSLGWHWCPHQCLRSRATRLPRATGPSTSVFDRKHPFLRVRLVPQRASSTARGILFGWHWCPHQCLRSRAPRLPRATVPPTSVFRCETHEHFLARARSNSPIDNQKSKIQNDSPLLTARSPKAAPTSPSPPATSPPTAS